MAVTTPALADLPEPVRARVVALAADVLPDVPSLPAPVRRVASFAPARRVRLAGTAILDALADEAFRERVGTQVAARPAPDDGDDVAVAARAWLTRPDGWADDVAARADRVSESAASSDDREVERLRAKVAQLEQAAREQRATARARAEEQKAENADLRRKLGQARAGERAERQRADEAEAAVDAARKAEEGRVADLEKDNRRLRAELERRDADLARARRDQRADRDEATLRARLLLDTVIDAATGLRRELALPTVDGTPADRVAADPAAEGRRTPTSPLGGADPALLEHHLAMPRARLVVDGYNVSKRAWPTASLEAQRQRLAGGLASLVARTGAETTVVFDAAETDHRPPVMAPRGERVVYSPRGVIADDVIRDLVSVEPEGRVVLVVTADRAVATDVAADGARVVDPEALIAVLTR